MTDTDLTNRNAFGVWSRERIRFGDTDQLGHVNNAVFVTLSEAGRIHFLHNSKLPSAGDGRAWVIARIVLDYRAELHWPDEVEIGTGVIKLGNTSVTLGQGMFLIDRCVATAENVMVLIDLKSRRPVALPDPLKAALADRFVKAVPAG
jgi:acyl-CoA thioester hydrolase